MKSIVGILALALAAPLAAQTPEDVAEAVLWVATRPPRVQVEWLRLGPA